MNSPRVLTAEYSNVNVAYSELWHLLRIFGAEENSRNGRVMVMPGPFITTYQSPRERVLFDPDRDANPIFHLMEAIWMFAGRDDVEFLTPFNARYEQYADADGTAHGAYGKRWRATFGMDQILSCLRVLRKDRNSRQAVITMWDPSLDLERPEFKDLPCNTTIYVDCRHQKLNMTVCCRSNDMVWGAYGANVVHFSMLQEVLAHGMELEMGFYTQISNNAHVYLDLPIVSRHLTSTPQEYDLYETREVVPFRMFLLGDNVEDFLKECEFFCANYRYEPNNLFLKMARRLQLAYISRRQGDLKWTEFMGDLPMRIDWVRAFFDWANRRKNVS